MTPPAERAARGKDLAAVKADWIAKVVTDPNKPADALVLRGFLGDSAKEDHVRLYTETDLSTWMDIPSADVLHAQRLPEEQSPLGEAVVWIRRNASLIHGMGAQQQSGTFFEGPIFQEHYAAAAGLGMDAYGFGGTPGPGYTFPPCGGVTLPPICPPPTVPPRCPIPSIPPRCPVSIPVRCLRTPIMPCAHSVPLFTCPVQSVVAPCITLNSPICPTQNVRCHLTPLCPVQSQLCPRTQFCPQSAAVVCTGVCPSAIDACPSAPGGCDTPWNPGGVINPAGFFGGGFGG